MSYKNQLYLFGGLMLVFGILIILVCGWSNLPFLYNGQPGPGFMPTISAVGISICGLGIMIENYVAAKQKKLPEGKFFKTPEQKKKFIVVIGSSCLVIALAEFLGLVPAITISIILLAKFLGNESWKTALLTGILTGIILWLIFVVLLDVPVPRGILGI